MEGLDKINTALQLANQNMSRLIETIAAIFPRGTGTLTCANAAATTVNNTNVAANSIVTLTPTNAAAGTLMAGATSLYLSARAPGTSFTVTTANGGSAAGTETFQYTITNPV